MSLKERLQMKETPVYQTEQDQPSLIQNEQELLMRLRAVEGYLSTVLQEVVQKEMTFQQEIDNLAQISKEFEELTSSTMKSSTESLSKRSKELEEHTSRINEQLKALISQYSKQLSENQQAIYDQMSEMQSSHLNQLASSQKKISDQLSETSRTANQSINAQQSELKEILINNARTIESGMNELKNKHERQLDEMLTTLKREISSVKRDIFITKWLDAGKQGLMTAVFMVPIYLVIRTIFSVIGVDLP